MGRTTLTSRGWARRLVVGTAAAASFAFLLPSGVAAAALPAAGAQQQQQQQQQDQQQQQQNQQQQQQQNQQQQAKAEQDQKKAADDAQKKQQQQQQQSEQKAKQDAAEKEAKQKAAAEAKAKAQAAERAAKERARAARRAAQLAAATQRARTSWDSHARPSKLAIVRSRTIDIVTNGSLTRQVPRRAGIVTISDLDRYLPPNWLALADGSAKMSSAVVLSPGVVMELGGDIKELLLAGGPKPSDAASIYTGSGKLRLHDATVGSYDPASGQPLPVGPGRPFIVVSSNGQFDAVDATVSDLGTSTEPDDRPGVLFGINSTGSMVRTTLLRNSTGMMLDRSNTIKLDGVTVNESTADGIVLRGDKATKLVNIRAERNGANGVLVTGLNSDRPITGISTAGNGGFGVVVANQTKPLITGIVTTGDGAGGLRVSRTTDAVVTDVVATDEPIGVLTHAGSTGATLDQLRITNSRRGVVIDKSVTGITVKASTIEGSDVVAVGVAGKETQINDVGVKDSGTGVRIERGAVGITATGLTISGGKDGVISTPGTTNLKLVSLVTDGVSSTAVRTFTPDAEITGGRITGSTTGIDTGAATTITGTTITQVDEGIRARSTDMVRADNIDVNAITAGITVADGSPFVLTSSRIDALEALHGVVQQQGSNELSLPPLNLLGAIGVPLILLALVLEQVNAFRQRSVGTVHRRQPPALPAGAG